MGILRTTLEVGKELTFEEQESAKRRIEAASKRSYVYDPDCPLLTPEQLAKDFPLVIFAIIGDIHNDNNLTNYYGKAYQARYLSGLAAGMKTKTNKIGFVSAWGTNNSEVTGGINAFALGGRR